MTDFVITLADGSQIKGSTKSSHKITPTHTCELMRPTDKSKRATKLQGSRRRWTPRGLANQPGGSFANQVYSTNSFAPTVDPKTLTPGSQPPNPRALSHEYYHGTGGA